MPADLTTAAGVIAGLVTVVGLLWREHIKSDADMKAQRDGAIARTDRLIDVSRDQVAATNRLADELEAVTRPKAG